MGECAPSTGLPPESKLGANEILGVSMAVCGPAAIDAGLPLYAYITDCTAVRRGHHTYCLLRR